MTLITSVDHVKTKHRVEPNDAVVVPVAEEACTVEWQRSDVAWLHTESSAAGGGLGGGPGPIIRGLGPLQHGQAACRRRRWQRQ